jgi:hypothetical protein
MRINGGYVEGFTGVSVFGTDISCQACATEVRIKVDKFEIFAYGLN